MKTLALVCNIVLFAFTGFVLATDGFPTKTGYIVLTLMLLIILIFTALVLIRSRAVPGSSTTLQRLAAICNIVLLGFICWALVDQYPHPDDPGVVPYAVLVVLTPILNATALLRHGRSDASPSDFLQTKSTTL